MIELGDTLPKFSLKDANGNLFLSSSLFGNNAVLFFYPKNFTPGCVQEVCSFRDAYQDFLDLGAQVVGISNDSQTSHQKFASRYQLPFPLLSDKAGKIKKLFGVKNSLLGLVPGRETFVFDDKGVLIFRFNSLNAKPHITKALKVLKKI